MFLFQNLDTTFNVSDLVFRGRCLWFQWFLVYNLCWRFWLFCFHMCSIFLSGFCFTYIYIMLFCLLISLVKMWFWWLNFSTNDKFASVTDVAAVYFIMLFQKMIILFWLHLFTLNRNYLNVFSLIFVLVTIIYLVGYIFIYFISCFLNIYLFFELFLLIIVTSYCILYCIYLYILVHITLNYFYIMSHILHWIVTIYIF